MIMVIGDLPLCNLTKRAQQIYLLSGFSPCVVSKICLVICHLRKKKLSADLRVPSSGPRNNCGRINGTRPHIVSKVAKRILHDKIQKHCSALRCPWLPYYPVSKLSGALWRRGRKRKESLQQRRFETLIGRDDISNDLLRVFQCLFTFALVSASRRLAEIWQLSRRGATGELKVEFKFQRPSCKLSFLFSPRRQRAPESLLAGYYQTNLHSNNRRYLSFRTHAGTSHPWRPCFLCPRCQIV